MAKNRISLDEEDKEILVELQDLFGEPTQKKTLQKVLKLSKEKYL